MKILILAQTPPPFHGQAIMQKYLVDAEWDWCEKKHIRMSYSSKIDEVGKLKISKIIVLWKIVFNVWKERIKGKIDVIYYPPAGPNKIPFYRDVITLLLIRWTAKKIIFHFHAGGINKLLSKLNFVEKIFADIALRKPDTSIILSDMFKNEIEWFESRKLFVIPNGIKDVQPRKSKIESEKIIKILTVGLISKEKGIFTLIETANKLKDINISFEWVIIGRFASESLEKQCKNRIASLNLSNELNFVGEKYNEEKWYFYNNADIFVFLSFQTEAQPLVLLEAMMFGLPLVATDWRGIPEIVDDGVNGFLVPVNNPEASAEKIKVLAGDYELRNRLGNEGRKKFLENYTVDKHLTAMENAIKQTALLNEEN